MIGCFYNIYCPATENMQSDKNEILNIFTRHEQCVYFVVFFNAFHTVVLKINLLGSVEHNK